MMYLFLQAVPSVQVDAVPNWVGNLSAPALAGVLVYYLITVTIPKLQEAIKELQDKFHDALDKERESREKLAEKTFEAHQENIKAIIDRDEKRQELNVKHHEQLITMIDALPSRFRSQV